MQSLVDNFFFLGYVTELSRLRAYASTIIHCFIFLRDPILSARGMMRMQILHAVNVYINREKTQKIRTNTGQ